MKTLIVISFPELNLSFKKILEISVVYIGHEIGYSGLGVLTINRTIDSSIDKNGKSGLLTSSVEIKNEHVKKSFFSKEKKEVLKEFKMRCFKEAGYPYTMCL